MSKSILVIDTPKSCRKCRLYRAYEFRQKFTTAEEEENESHLSD